MGVAPVLVLGLMLGGGAAAEAAPAPEEPAAAAVPEVPHLEGPRLVDLGAETEIDLPAGFVLYERAQARALLQKGGDAAEHVLAIVARPERNWIVVIESADVGYVTDTDAGQLDAGELLEAYRQGTAAQNATRRQLGVAELFIDGWSEPPHYAFARRQLSWGLAGHTAEGAIINFFTNALGRGGYLSLNLVDDPSAIERSKEEAAPILAATRYKPGARYEDHREGDRSSGLGLRMLVLGGAGIAAAKAAKAGVLIAILLALKKGLVVIGLAIAGFFKWLFGRRPRAAPADAEAAPAPALALAADAPADADDAPPDADDAPPS